VDRDCPALVGHGGKDISHTSRLVVNLGDVDGVVLLGDRGQRKERNESESRMHLDVCAVSIGLQGVVARRIERN
jgi:hypothetical protein